MKLAVEVLRAQDLKPRGGHGGANPFVEVDFNGQRRRTSTKLNSLHPQWNETLFFDLADPLDLPERTIHVSVNHEELSTGRRRKFLGHVRISGSSAAPSRLEAARQFCPLDKRGLFSNVRGEIDLRLYVVHDAAGYGADDGQFFLSASPYPPSSPVPDILAPASPTVSPAAAAMLPPKKNRERREFHSIGSSSRPAKSHASYMTQVFSNLERKQHRPSQFYYRVNHEQTQPTVATPAPAAPPPKPAPAAAAPPPKSASASAVPPPKPEYKVVETKPPLAALLGYLCTCNSDKIKNTFDLVEQMDFLYVRIVRARELPAMDFGGSLDPYVVVKLGDVALSTSHREQNWNPEWEEAFAFSMAHARAPRVELVVKDKNLLKDSEVGKISVAVGDLPKRVPPDGPVAPEWYKLWKGNSAANDESYRGEIMVAVWWGTQADEAYPVAVHADTYHLSPAAVHHTRGKVYYSPRMSYLRVNVVSAQDLQVSRPDPEICVVAQLGTQQQQQTQVSRVRSHNPTWKNEALMLVAAEPFDERLALTVVDKATPNKPEPVARLIVPKSAIKNHADHRKPLGPQWLALESPDGGSGGGNYGKLNVALYHDNNYHVLDEHAHFSSDFQPSAKPLRRADIGSLDLGIIDARNLTPLIAGGGKSANGYCVAKYGRKWVRSRTILGTTTPAWNEQYSWDVHDPYTVLTVAVFNNNQVDSKNNGGGSGRDEPLGRIRIRLSALDIGRVYTHYYPLMVVHPTGLKKTGELHLAVRFSCNSWFNTLFLYVKPTFPKMHYLQPIPVSQMDFLRYHARRCVAAKLARAEPPLRMEAVAYILEDGSNSFGLRKAKANFQRVLDLFTDAKYLAKWFDDVRRWKRPAVTVAAHAALFVLAWCPNSIIPAAFLGLFLISAWRYRRRPRLPAHVDMSLADVVQPDELDEELDVGWPSTMPDEVIARRYYRLRTVAGRLQEMVGDAANNAERLEALVSWRDPRATTIFVAFATAMATVWFWVPLELLAVAIGVYVMRHPRFRSKTPSVPLNFFKRLPGKAETML